MSNATDWRTWQPSLPGDPDRVPLVHSFTATATLPAGGGGLERGEKYKVGISLRDPVEVGCSARNAVQFANAGIMERYVRSPEATMTEYATACFNGTSMVGEIQT